MCCVREGTHRLDINVRDADVAHVPSSVALLEANASRRVANLDITDGKVLECSVVAPAKVDCFKPVGMLCGGV
jgi:hypothetical protein